jgi:soluble lytic murein transglycosylase
MSSMWRFAVILPVLVATAPSSSAQYAASYSAPYNNAPPLASNVSYALESWRRLRQSNGYSFADYAPFLIANRDWPDEARMRAWAEQAMRPGENATTVIAFFNSDKPTSGNGWARLADAYAQSGRPTEALEAARNAWASPDLSLADEQSIWARFGNSFTRADQDRRTRRDASSPQ